MTSVQARYEQDSRRRGITRSDLHHGEWTLRRVPSQFEIPDDPLGRTRRRFETRRDLSVVRVALAGERESSLRCRDAEGRHYCRNAEESREGCGDDKGDAAIASSARREQRHPRSH